MEVINNIGSDSSENSKEMNSSEERNQKLGDYNVTSKVNDKNITVDCIHWNVDDDRDEVERVSGDVKDFVEENEVYKTHLKIHTEDLIRKVWPDNVVLYQPVESEQLLFSEMPHCLYVQTFLRMCNLPYTLVQRTNAESIGPSGEVPVLKCGKFFISGADQIIKFVESKGLLLTDGFKEAQKIDISCYISLVQMTLACAEDFITWLDPETYSKVTKRKLFSIHPWPLSLYLMRQKKKKVQNKLAAMGWGCKTFEDVCEEVNLCFKALSDKMEENYFIGNQPTQMDALLFAHAYTIMSNPLPNPQFAGIILRYPNIVKHCYIILHSFFNELNTSDQFAELVNNLTS